MTTRRRGRGHRQAASSEPDGIIGRSPAIRALVSTIERVAPPDATCWSC